MTPDVETLRRRVTTLTRALSRISLNAADLHSLAWEPRVGDAERVNGGAVDHSPRTGDPRAIRLFANIAAAIEAAEADLVGLDRQMMGLFTARAERPDPTRGSIISVAEFDAKLAAQRRRGDAPVRLEPQPPHPGRR